MIYDLSLAWRNIRYRLVESVVPIIVVALAVALSVIVFVMADGAEEGIVQASDPFGVLVVGSSGSGQQLVLSSILLQGNPIGNIPYSVYEQLENDTRVKLVVPLAFGDNVGGARIIGTDKNFLELRTSQLNPPAFQVGQGTFFSDDSVFEAVLGADAARRLGLGIGDAFQGTHGVTGGIAENLHDERYTIVGILAPSGTAYDQAVYTQIQSVWDAHGEATTITNELGINADGVLTSLEVGGATLTNQVTAILVLPNGFIEQNQIAQEFYSEPTLQVAFPGQELGNLISLVNQGQQILNLIGYLVLGIAGMTVFLSMYNAIQARRQSIAIMRSLGGNRVSIIRIVIFETLILSVLGAVLGRVIGYGVAIIFANIYSANSAIPIPIRFLPELEVSLWVLSIGVGLIAGIIPALMAYRVNIVENLFPS